MLGHSAWTRILVISWFILMLVYFNVLPSIEGSLFRVIENFSVTKMEDTKNGILIYGNFDKVRNCEFNRLRAFLTNKNGFTEELETSLQERGTVREIGNHDVGPWFIQVDAVDFNNVTLTMTYTCHPFWQTSTRLLPK